MAKNFGIGSISFIGGFMEYVYHMVPEELKGEYLIPLNELKRVYPNLYREYIQKYKDHTQRENLLTRKIPKLECLWNDVVHFYHYIPMRFIKYHWK